MRESKGPELGQKQIMTSIKKHFTLHSVNEVWGCMQQDCNLTAFYLFPPHHRNQVCLVKKVPHIFRSPLWLPSFQRWDVNSLRRAYNYQLVAAQY